MPYYAYGKAILEGAFLGITTAVSDIVQHPMQAALSCMAGEYVLAFQLSKVIFDIAEITAITIIDRKKGADALENYIKPLKELMVQISFKEETVRESIKHTTAFIVGWKAQNKILRGLRSFTHVVHDKAIRFAISHPKASAEKYLTTPDGLVLKSVHKSIQTNAKNCPASCAIQYEKLKKDLTKQQYTSIIKCTKHGLERLIERGFQPEEVFRLIHYPDFLKIQTDGAKVFITQLSANRYNIIILNERKKKLITALKNINLNAIQKLGNNYGWTIQ